MAPPSSASKEKSKLKASDYVVRVYNANRQRLSSELAKPNKDRACLNAIEAYRHIVSHIERVYNLAPDA